MKRTALAFAGLVILGACSRESAPVSRTAPVREVTHGEAAVTDDPGECPIDSAGRYTDPVALVRAWSDSDRVGGTLGGEDWTSGALSCVERATSDMIYITGPFTIRSLTTTVDTATIARAYRRYFAIEYDSAGGVMHLEPSDVDIIDTVRVVRMPLLKWRIDRIDGGAHLSAAVALARLTRLDSVGSDRLRELRSRP